MAKVSEQNACSRAVILLANGFCFENEAILASPLLRKLGI